MDARQGVVVVVDQEEVVLVVLEEALALGDQGSGPGGLRQVGLGCRCCSSWLVLPMVAGGKSRGWVI
jgi:hypothetical protein